MAFTGIFIYTLTGLKALSVNLGLPTTQHILPASWVMSLILSGCIFSGIKISIDPGFFTTQDFAHPAPINAFYWDHQRFPPPFCSKSSFFEQSVEMEKNWAKKMQSPQTSQCPCFGQRSHGCKQRLSSDIHNFRSVGIIKRRGELWRHKMIFSEFSPNVKKKCWHFSRQFSYSVNKQIPLRWQGSHQVFHLTTVFRFTQFIQFTQFIRFIQLTGSTQCGKTFWHSAIFSKWIGTRKKTGCVPIAQMRPAIQFLLLKGGNREFFPWSDTTS